MGSIVNVPVGAVLKERHSGIIEKPDAWTHGKRVTLCRYDTYKSMGYKTNYQAVPCVFLVIQIQGERSKAYQYSGKRLAKGEALFETWKRDLLPFMRIDDASDPGRTINLGGAS